MMRTALFAVKLIAKRIWQKFADSFFELLSADMLALTFVLAIAGVMAGVGILMSEANRSALIPLRDALPFGIQTPLWIWASMFFLYAVIKLARAFIKRTDLCKTLNAVLGMGLWSMMLGTAFTAPTWDGMKLLYAVPLLCDGWMFAQVLKARRKPGPGMRYESGFVELM